MDNNLICCNIKTKMLFSFSVSCTFTLIYMYILIFICFTLTYLQIFLRIDQDIVSGLVQVDSKSDTLNNVLLWHLHLEELNLQD